MNESIFRFPINILEDELEVTEFNIEHFLKLEDTTRNVIDKYPAIYVFYNKKSMYIGESVHPFRRLKQHYLSKKLELNDRILVFRSPQFHKSAIYDIETKLIELIKVENKIILRNDNLNQKNHFYFLKHLYEPVLEKIWEELKSRKLTFSSINDIRESNAFKLSPFKGLNSDQQEVIDTINKQCESTLIIGKPGTGKSILATRTFIDLAKNFDVVLTSGTLNTVKSFKNALKNEMKNIKTNSKILKLSELFGVKKEYKNFNIIIVDEGHRLSWRGQNRNPNGQPSKYMHINKGSDELMMILENFRSAIIFYDSNQIVHDGDVDITKYLTKFRKFRLNQQMRNSNNEKYTNWIINLLSDNPTDLDKKDLKNYTFKIYNNFANLYDVLKKKSKSSNFTRLLSGPTKDWKSLKDPSKFDFEIDGIKLRWNNKNLVQSSKWLNSKPAIELEEVTFYNVIQGFDLEHVGVIVGKDLGCKDGKLFARPEHIMHHNQLPKKNDPLFNEKILKWTLNRYKIILTRATKSVHVYFEDKEVQKYFEKYII